MSMVTRLILFSATLVVINAEQQPLVHAAFLDSEEKFLMRWTPEKDFITIQVEVATLGYVGLGFSPNGAMKNSDIILGFVDHHGRVNLTDRHATGDYSPELDASQDVELISGHKNRTHTVIRFRRKWDTCDEKHDMKITSDTVRVIYAYDPRLPDPTSSTIHHHRARGVRSLFLVEPILLPQELSDDVKYFDIVSRNVALPNDLDTVYWCSIHKTPSFKSKTHYIGYVPIVDALSGKYVHHLQVHECYLTDAEKNFMDSHIDASGVQCDTPNMPNTFSKCRVPFINWATGSEGVFFPDNVGYPISDGDHRGHSYFMLEMHYDNPRLDSGIRDNSGIRMYYTDVIREFDVGTFASGQSVSALHIIPPRSPNWRSVSYCPRECSSKAIPKEGINVFSGMLHAHLLARAITTQHIRDGQELEPILQDRSYDFNYQQERYLSVERVVLPGDEFRVTCTFDSTGRKNTTFGGESTYEEMCQVYLLYYPRIDLTYCATQPDLKGLLDTFGIKLYDEEETIRKYWATKSIEYDNANDNLFKVRYANALKALKIREPPKWRDMTVLEVMEQHELWTDLEQALQEYIETGPYRLNCAQRDTEKIPGVPLSGRLGDFEKYEAVSSTCTKSYTSYTIVSSGAEQTTTATSALLIVMSVVMVVLQ